MNLAIIGSCVSRDLLNVTESDSFSLSRYIARSSFGSMFASPPFEDIYSGEIKSDFQARMVAADIQKKAPDLLTDIRADAFVVDFVDERFSLLKSPAGGFCTLSDEARPVLSGFLRSLPDGWSVVASGSEEFLDAWEIGWNNFLDFISLHYSIDCVLVHQVYWQAKTSSGNNFPHSSQARIDDVNAVLDRLYAIAKLRIPSVNFITYPEGTLQCDDRHQWGVAPFHYTRQSQAFGLEKICSFLKSR